jgi:hypothetical protein
MAETLCGARANQKGGGWHTKQSYIALVLEQIGAYGLFGETSGNVRQWIVHKEIYETLQRLVLKLDDQRKIIGPWKWAKVERKANCPPLAGLPTGVYRAVSQVVPAGAMSIAPLLNHVRDRRLSDQKRGPDDYWVKTRKRHRLSAEATVTGPEKTDADKRVTKRMKESQSPRT